MPAEARSRQAGSPSRVTRAHVALPRRTRSAAASSTWRPRRPAETRTVPCSRGVLVHDQLKGPPRAQRTDATDDVAGRPFRLRGFGHRRPPTADDVGQALQVELPIDRDDGQDQPAVDRDGERLEHAGRVDPEGRRGVHAVDRAPVAVPAVGLRGPVLVDRVRHPGPDDDVERAGPGGGAFHGLGVDASHFRYAPGGPTPSASIDARSSEPASRS